MLEAEMYKQGKYFRFPFYFLLLSNFLSTFYFLSFFFFFPVKANIGIADTNL